MGPLRKSISPELTSGVWAATVISYELFQKTQIANSNNLSAAGLVFICASQCTLQLILTNLCLPRARSPRGVQGKAWKPHGSSTERAKGFPNGKTHKEAQVLFEEPTATTFFERREAKVV